MIRITVNGEPREVDHGTTLRDLVQTLAFASERIAVEHNREVVARTTWEATRLHEGDRIEIVHFVGGGRSRTPVAIEHDDLSLRRTS